MKTTASKHTARAVVVSAFLALACLTGCGSGSSNGRYFAYLESTGVSAAVLQAHTGAKQPPAPASRETATRASDQPASVSIASGSDNINIYDTNTNTITNIAKGLAVESVQLSPDGEKLVASATDTATGDWQIYLADKTFKTVTQLTTDYDDHYDAAFSADGETVAYDAYDATAGTYQLFTVSETSPFTQTALSTPTEIKTPGLWALAPSFTPDGKSLVFWGITFESGESVLEAIYAVKIADGIVTELSMPINNSTLNEVDRLPSVSPDGTQVSFMRDTAAEGNSTIDIFAMPITGETATSRAKGLTTGLITAGTSQAPLYLDNSNENIVYLSSEPNFDGTYNPNIFEMNRDGTTTGLSKTQLTDTTLADFFNYLD